MKEKIKDLQDELTKHKAAAVRRLQPIDPNNADSFNYEREDPGTDDDGGAECPATTSAVVPQRATPPKTKAWWQLLRIGQILTYNKVKCQVQSEAQTLSGPTVTVELLAGESKGTCVSVKRWSDLDDVGQKFWHPRKGKPCSVIQITRGHVDGEPSLLVSFDDDASIVETEFYLTSSPRSRPKASSRGVPASCASASRARSSA